MTMSIQSGLRCPNIVSAARIILQSGLTLLLLATLVQSAIAEVRVVHTTDPRAFGHFLGDTLTRTIEIQTGPDDELVLGSLPRTGPSTYSLEVRAVEYSSEQRADGRLHTVKITYQNFFAPLDVRTTTIPATEIAIRGPIGNETVVVPPFAMVISPIRETFPDKGDSTDLADALLRPDAPMVNRQTAAFRTLILIPAIFVPLFLTLLARELAFWPFHPRPARPFTRALREIRRAFAKREPDDAYRNALLALHRAFDTAAGRRMFAADVDRFIAAHPEHDDNRLLVQRFFEASRVVFFGEAPHEGEAHLPQAELKALVVALAQEERAAR